MFKIFEALKNMVLNLVVARNHYIHILLNRSSIRIGTSGKEVCTSDWKSTHLIIFLFCIDKNDVEEFRDYFEASFIHNKETKANYSDVTLNNPELSFTLDPSDAIKDTPWESILIDCIENNEYLGMFDNYIKINEKEDLNDFAELKSFTVNEIKTMCKNVFIHIRQNNPSICDVHEKFLSVAVHREFFDCLYDIYFKNFNDGETPEERYRDMVYFYKPFFNMFGMDVNVDHKGLLTYTVIDDVSPKLYKYFGDDGFVMDTEKLNEEEKEYYNKSYKLYKLKHLV